MRSTSLVTVNRRQVIGGASVALASSAIIKPVLATADVMQSYIAYLAHEHRRALIEHYGDASFMYWMPDNEIIVSLLNGGSPRTRANQVLEALA